MNTPKVATVIKHEYEDSSLWMKKTLSDESVAPLTLLSRGPTNYLKISYWTTFDKRKRVEKVWSHNKTG